MGAQRGAADSEVEDLAVRSRTPSRPDAMDARWLLVAGVAAAALAALASCLASRWRFWRAVERLPGLLNLPAIGTGWVFIFLKRKDLLALMKTMSDRYQPMYRTWYGRTAEVHMMRPDNIEKVLGSTELITKSMHYRFMKPWLGDGLLLSTGRKWQTRRKLLTPAFHFKILENFVDVFAEKSQLLVKKLNNSVGEAEFDVCPYIALCSLDIICETAMGTCVNALEDSESEYVSATCSLTEWTMGRILKPWLYNEFIFRMTPGGREYYKRLSIVHKFSKQVIKDRKLQRELSGVNGISLLQDDTGAKKRVAFLDLLLDMSKDGECLDDAAIQEEVDTFMFEGHDTTSAAMSWTVFMLGLHPDVQQKAYEELNTIFQGSNRQLTMQDFQNMKYLEMVIKETLRLYPSVPFIGRVNSKDTEIGGYSIPEGVMLALHLYETHRDENTWPNPEQFDPERFLPDRTQGRHPFAYVPFSAGPRNCIGQKFAMLEQKAVLSSLLRSYKIESMQRREDCEVAAEMILRPMNGLKIKLRPR